MKKSVFRELRLICGTAYPSKPGDDLPAHHPKSDPAFEIEGSCPDGIPLTILRFFHLDRKTVRRSGRGRLDINPQVVYYMRLNSLDKVRS